jgi:uncharacterized membrane protein YsdA (DUF1294 family)
VQLVPTLLSWLVAINLVTGAAYAFDKVAARRGGRRIREQMLWLLCLLMRGSPPPLRGCRPMAPCRGP